MRYALDDFVGSIKVGRTISNLRYGDDVVLMAGSMEDYPGNYPGYPPFSTVLGLRSK